MESPGQDRKWIWVARAALILYFVLAVILILQRPGLYYDEALMVVDAVHMRHSPAELALPHDPDTWICVRGRCFPLMMMSYIGPIKEYLCLPLFAGFGPRVPIIRIVSVLLSLICIWGVGRLVGEQVSRPAGAFAAVAIAINPAFVNATVFDNGAVAGVMAALGLVCLAMSAYVRKPGTRSAFWIGAAMGFGIWTRANFLWVDVAVLAAALVVLRREFLFPLRHWIGWMAGGMAGGLPFLAYQVHSKFGTWQATSMFLATEPFARRLFDRTVLLSETLLTDREHRAMWDGPAMPGWQRWFFPAVVVASLLICALTGGRRGRMRARWAQGAAVAFLVLALFHFLTRTRISEHHLVGLVPLAAVVVVLACAIVQERFHWGWGLAGGLAAVYVSCAIYWHVATIEGLHRTRGVGPWSDGIYRVARDLSAKYPAQEVKILDWGLEDNLYVLTDARLHTREIYSEGTHAPWMEEIRRGGIFLMNGPENRQFPEASEAFLKTLAEARPAVQRMIFPQRSGIAFAELIEIQPDSIGQGRVQESASGVRQPEELDGFYPPEQGGWRWTKREFSATFAGRGAARLILQVYVPDASIQKLGQVTLSARCGGHTLAPQTFRQSGQFTYERDVPGDWMRAGSNRFEFTLDKAIAPSAEDPRELGIVVASLALEAR